MEAQEKGEFHPSGSEDVLTTALQTPEHTGRVRGVGGFITPKQFFNSSGEKNIRITKAELMARDRKMAEKMQNLESEIATLKALLVNGQANHGSPIFSDKASVGRAAAVPDQNTKPTAAKGLVLADEDCVDLENPPPPPPPKNLVKL